MIPGALHSSIVCVSDEPQPGLAHCLSLGCAVSHWRSSVSSAGNLTRFNSDTQHLCCGIPCSALVPLLACGIAAVHLQTFSLEGAKMVWTKAAVEGGIRRHSSCYCLCFWQHKVSAAFLLCSHGLLSGYLGTWRVVECIDIFCLQQGLSSVLKVLKLKLSDARWALHREGSVWANCSWSVFGSPEGWRETDRCVSLRALSALWRAPVLHSVAIAIVTFCLLILLWMAVGKASVQAPADTLLFPTSSRLAFLFNPWADGAF